MASVAISLIDLTPLSAGWGSGRPQTYWAHNAGVRRANEETMATLPAEQAALSTFAQINRHYGDASVAHMKVRDFFFGPPAVEEPDKPCAKK